MKNTRTKQELEVEYIKTSDEAGKQWFDELMAQKHYLGAGVPVGDYHRQVVKRDGEAVGLLAWGPACYSIKDRDLWIGWSADKRVKRLKLIVQNRRFLLLTQRGEEPNLASAVLGAALRALPQQWKDAFGYRPLLAETFTDPESFHGTCYKASNWLAVGTSAGFKRHRADFYVAGERPKKLWMKELCVGGKKLITGTELPEECVGGVVKGPAGVLPINQPEMLSLRDAFIHAPDPRSKSAQYRTGPVLTIIAMALMAGRREIAEIARFANTLTPQQRRVLGMPRKKGTKAFYKVPGYDVFYQILTRMDPEAFAQILSTWMQQNHQSIPAALAMDGKMIRDHIGLLTLCEHRDGSPHAVEIYDQKEGTERCEQTSAVKLLAKLPKLDGTTVTADPLHCQKKTARAIVEKGGDYLIQIKANQKKLLAQAQAFEQLPDPFFLIKGNSVGVN